MFHKESCCNGRWHALPRPIRIAGYVVMGLLVAASFALVFGYVTMVIWNAILPDITSLPALTFWQAVGLLFLARLFTGRFSHGHPRHHFHCRTNERTADRYGEWWNAEGEAAFKAYLQGDPSPDDTHE